jgi:hypothetical protein
MPPHLLRLQQMPALMRLDHQETGTDAEVDEG